MTGGVLAGAWRRAGLLSLLALAGCRSLESIPYTPPQTPATWLEIQPYAVFTLGQQEIFLMQPSTTAIVYLLGVITILVGGYFLRIRQGHAARLWWGVALLLWGLGALFAGTSYEAFSYAIKCAGRDACLWTSGWEIIYLLLSGASINAMLVGVAYACAAGTARQRLIAYAVFNLVLYSGVVLVGAWIPVKFLISFELLILANAPTMLIFLVLNTRRYRQHKHPLDRALLFTWGGLLLTIAAYFGYYLSGLTQQLWAQGFWFSENDVLHIGLILWMFYLGRVLAPWLKDMPPAAAINYGPF